MTSQSATNVYRAYVISETGDEFTFISERDKKLHTASKIFGEQSIPEYVTLGEEHVVCIQRPYFTDPSRLYTACREYCYDKKKNQKAAVRRNAMLKEKRQKAKEERQKAKEEQQKANEGESTMKSVMGSGKHKNATYQDIMLLDSTYCDWILRSNSTNKDIVKFKAYLKENYEKFKDDCNREIDELLAVTAGCT